MAHAADPSYGHAVFTNAEYFAGRPPLESPALLHPRIWQQNQAIGAHAGPLQLLVERCRNRDDCTEAAEGKRLETLIKAVLPPSAGEAMNGGDRRHAGPTRNSRREHVGPVSVSMHHVGPEAADHFGKETPLSPVCACGERQRIYVDIRIAQSAQKGMVTPAFIEDGSYSYSVTSAPVTGRQHVHHALQAADGARGGDVENG